MLFVRPSKLSDLDQIERMARSTGPILHSLPPDRARLQQLVTQSINSLAEDVEFPGEESYLFVLEDSDTGKLYGTAGLLAMAGFSEPFYVFRNEVVVHASRELQVNHRVHALALSHEMTGRTRLTGFHVDAAALQHGVQPAHLLSRARMLFAAQHRERFAHDIFSVLPGVADEAGRSPFWEGVGYKFFKRDFREMELESGGRSRTFIAEMMPVDPLYVPLLDEEAQRVMGEPHIGARLNYQCHIAEGLEPDHFVDIFDAGPVLTSALDMCNSVRFSRRRPAVRGEACADGVPYLVSNTQAADAFRAVLVTLPAVLPAQLTLPQAAADVLEIADGDEVRCAPLQPEGATA
ncbi:arginine N-succinyltransferase [Crenobacter sp. SG2305]|uniref:arginine N-succinyltransferase n=1 Tax=Crenobacter oryzisoli TaxID=3056844 RepID=UPI0025AB453B|nr:arginine N-succinyltransferase [Crenobacter sp. SG2305]MDN0083351.1 arginine N-succinyltransferase [Crenobacter sp. SG2305]